MKEKIIIHYHHHFLSEENYFAGGFRNNPRFVPMLFDRLPRQKSAVFDNNGSMIIGWFTVKEIEYMRRGGLTVSIFPTCVREIHVETDKNEIEC